MSTRTITSCDLCGCEMALRDHPWRIELSRPGTRTKTVEMDLCDACMRKHFPLVLGRDRAGIEAVMTEIAVKKCGRTSGL